MKNKESRLINILDEIKRLRKKLSRVKYQFKQTTNTNYKEGAYCI